MSQHLGNWAPAFIKKALEYAKTEFYEGRLLMLRGFFANEKRE
jgi:TorA maturation chaperone TorD